MPLKITKHRLKKFSLPSLEKHQLKILSATKNEQASTEESSVDQSWVKHQSKFKQAIGFEERVDRSSSNPTTKVFGGL